jgi:hypothetical protein
VSAVLGARRVDDAGQCHTIAYITDALAIKREATARALTGVTTANADRQARPLRGEP